MRRPSKYYAELFVRASKDITPRELDVFTHSFVKLLAKENALSRFHEINRLIGATINRVSGHEDVVVTTAEPLKTSVLQALHRMAKTQGFSHVEVVVDSELVGGSVVQIGDRRIDQSVKGALVRLYETLTS